jgi:transposase
VRVGMEATGYSRWFERLLAELGIELWIGDAADIKTKRVRKQKTDREDARLLLRLLRENNFPRIWVPSPENRDLRQLLWHRHRMVQMRTRIMNQLQALAMNEGQRRKKKLWNEQGRTQLEKLPLAPWASRRRKDLLELLDRMNPPIQELTGAVEQEARKRPEVLRLMTHPGVANTTFAGAPIQGRRWQILGIEAVSRAPIRVVGDLHSKRASPVGNMFGSAESKRTYPSTGVRRVFY